MFISIKSIFFNTESKKFPSILNDYRRICFSMVLILSISNLMSKLFATKFPDSKLIII
jgi:hypothetical protein